MTYFNLYNFYLIFIYHTDFNLNNFFWNKLLQKLALIEKVLVNYAELDVMYIVFADSNVTYIVSTASDSDVL